MIPIYSPYLNKKTKDYGKEAIDSGWISSHGEFLERARDEIKKIYPKHKIILTNSGTSAMHLASLALQRKFPHIKKIIVANNVYVAAWNSFIYDNKYELIPVDADINTWNFDLSKISQHIDNRTCILATHNIGNIINVPKLQEEFPDTPIIEDNCEGFLGSYRGCQSGSESFASAVSFFANKTITSGEGGLFVTKDKDIFEYINSVKNQGQSNTRYLHNHLGYNYRMTNLQAALLTGQLESRQEILHKKKEIFEAYFKHLTHPKIFFQSTQADTTHSNWMLGVRFSGFNEEKRKRLQFHLQQNGIDTREMFYPIGCHKHLKDMQGEQCNASVLRAECLVLPSYPDLRGSQVELISENILSFVNNES